MAQYRKNLFGDAVMPAKDIDVAAGQVIDVEDLVTLDAAGKLVKANAASTTLLGVSEGPNVQTAAAAKLGLAKHKVKVGRGQVIEMKYVGADPVLGTAYAINDAQQVDTVGAGAKVVEVTDVIDTVNKIVYVTIALPAIG